MLVLTIQTEMPLAEPNVEFGFVTWLAVSIRQFDAPTREPVGHARIAVIQVADAAKWRDHILQYFQQFSQRPIVGS